MERIPKPIGQMMSCFENIIPNTNGCDFFNPNCDPAVKSTIFAGPGLATMEQAKRNKPQKY